jgi:HEAT repeats
MSGVLFEAEYVASVLMWTSIALALIMVAAVVGERAAIALLQLRYRRIERRYGPLLGRALIGEDAAMRELVASPARHRLDIARLLIEPLIDDRNPDRILRTRAIVDALSLIPRADRYLRSRWWWRRALALRALGLVQVTGHTAAIVAALDDPHPDVRAAALDALTDMRDPASLPAIVVRLHDASLHRGRRAAALAAFGPECEAFLLELSQVDAMQRVNYARALAICGSEQSRAALAHWTDDTRADVRAAAFAALAHVGLDTAAARRAIEALESADTSVREMAAFALHGWTGDGDAAVRLAQHLDDAWPVALRAARSLRAMGHIGLSELEARTSRPDLAGVLARQMLWQGSVRC